MFGPFRRHGRSSSGHGAARDGAAGGASGALVADALERAHRGGLRPALTRLDTAARARLLDLATDFLDTRRFEGGGGFEPDAPLAALVAVEACTPLVNLPAGLDAVRAARTFILHPSGFRVDQRWTDEDGIEHEREAELAGEAWAGGPVVLAADDVEASAPGFDVVVHEIAHVLDAANGRVNGFPDVRDQALRRAWPQVFGAAFQALGEALERGDPVPVDDYALEDPAEFFAVCTETFFTDPRPLRWRWPETYAALAAFYGQAPGGAPTCEVPLR